MFYDREDELASLRAEHEREQFSLIVIYGRRRVGKTELIKEFCENTRHVYHLVSQDSAKVQREKLVEELADHKSGRIPRIEDWHDAIDYLDEHDLWHLYDLERMADVFDAAGDDYVAE